MPAWRNWQTRLIQNQVPYGSGGSSPLAGTYSGLTRENTEDSALLITCQRIGRAARFQTSQNSTNRFGDESRVSKCQSSRRNCRPIGFTSDPDRRSSIFPAETSISVLMAPKPAKRNKIASSVNGWPTVACFPSPGQPEQSLFRT